MRDMQAMSTMGMGAAAGPQMGPTGQPQDMQKVFLGEKENLELTEHEWGLDNVETRLLVKYGKKPRSVLLDYKKSKAAAVAASSASHASSQAAAITASAAAGGSGRKKGKRQA